MSAPDLRQHVYAVLRDKLINCEYRPGAMLNETDLSVDLGVSRTPVREALHRVELEGLVRIVPRRGVQVAPVLLADIEQIFQVRLEVEPIALRLAAGSLPAEELRWYRRQLARTDLDPKAAFGLDMSMHLFFIGHCGNRHIMDMMRRVFDGNRRAVIHTRQDELRIHDARDEHVQILDLLLARDVEGACRALRQHIVCCRDAAMEFYVRHLDRGETAAESAPAGSAVGPT
ncbi:MULTISPECIES: GntR family transcriptional regulator [unclassified Modestobacter]